MNNSIHGGVITTKIDYDTQLNSLLNNCDFEVISSGSFGYAIKAMYNAPTPTYTTKPLEFFDFVYNSNDMKSIPIKEFAIKICILNNKTRINPRIQTISETEFKDEIVKQQLIYTATTAGYYSLVPYVFYSNTNFRANELTPHTGEKIVNAIVSYIDETDPIHGNWILNENIQIGIIVMQIPFTPRESAFEMSYLNFESNFCKKVSENIQNVQYQCLCIAIEHLLRFMLTSGYVHGDFHTGNMLTSNTDGNYYAKTTGIEWAETWSFSIIDFGRARYMTKNEYNSFKEKLIHFLHDKSKSALEELTKFIFELGSSYDKKVSLFTDEIIREKLYIYYVYKQNEEIISLLYGENIDPTIITQIERYMEETLNKAIKIVTTQQRSIAIDILENINYDIDLHHDDLHIYTHIEKYPQFYKWIFSCINDNIADTVHKLILSRKQRLIEIIEISKTYIDTNPTQDETQIVATEIDLFKDLGSIKPDNSIMFAYGFDTTWYEPGIYKVKPKTYEIEDSYINEQSKQSAIMSSTTKSPVVSPVESAKLSPKLSEKSPKKSPVVSAKLSPVVSAKSPVVSAKLSPKQSNTLSNDMSTENPVLEKRKTKLEKLEKELENRNKELNDKKNLLSKNQTSTTNPNFIDSMLALEITVYENDIKHIEEKIDRIKNNP
jgi:hypothetical protein